MIVDCDIHNAPVSETALHAYLPEAWRRRAQRGRAARARGRGEPRDARRPLLPRLGVPAGDAARGAHRRMAARRLAAGVEPPVPARAAPGPLRHRVRRADPDARRRRAARPRVGRGARVGHQRLAGRRVARPGAAAARVDQRRLRGRRALRARDRTAAPTTRASCRCSCSSAPPSRSGAASTGRCSAPRRSAACRSASTTAAGAAGR